MRLILHAGTHKTGTSSIQRALYEHREVLRQHGLLYPDPRPWFGGTFDAHHPLVHAVARQDEDLPVVRRMLAHVREDVRPGETVLLSAEPVYRHVLRTAPRGGWWRRHRAFLRALADELEDFDVEVVVVLRRRDTFLESIYHERVAHGFGGDFGELRAADRLLDYDRQCELLGEELGPVQSLHYESLTAEGLVDSFLSRLGVEAPGLDTGDWDRRSVDARMTLWMAACYREDPDEELVVQRRRFSKNPVSNDLFDDWGRVTLWTDEDSRRALLEEYGSTASVHDDRAPAILTRDDEDRIDDAFDAYLVAKGLPPTRRRARRAAVS